MSGQTDGLDLTVETLQFVEDNWAGVADSFTRAEDWDQPVLRNADDKTIYSSGETSSYDAALRANDLVTVEDAGRTDEVTGTAFDFDVEWELDVRIEALNNGQTVIGGSTDWKVFRNVVRRCILARRRTLPADPNCKFDWRWLTVADSSTLPESDDNRDYYGQELTILWMGYERLLGGIPANTAFEVTFEGPFVG